MQGALSTYPSSAAASSRTCHVPAYMGGGETAAAEGGPRPDPSQLSAVQRLERLASENAVIVFSRRGCCMGHVVRRLLLTLGANPAMYEVGDEDEANVLEATIGNSGGGSGRVQFPAVFIGGSLFGGLDRVMSTHISGELIPILKRAGALWL